MSDEQKMQMPRYRCNVPSANDVLCGKSTGLAKHHGNVLFKNLISSYLDSYNDEQCSKSFKMKLTTEIVGVLKDQFNSKFLKFDQKGGFWEEVCSQKAREKVSHALKHAFKKQKQDKHQSASLRVVVPTERTEAALMGPQKRRNEDVQNAQKRHCKREGAIQIEQDSFSTLKEASSQASTARKHHRDDSAATPKLAKPLAASDAPSNPTGNTGNMFRQRNKPDKAQGTHAKDPFLDRSALSGAQNNRNASSSWSPPDMPPMTPAIHKNLGNLPALDKIPSGRQLFPAASEEEQKRAKLRRLVLLSQAAASAAVETAAPPATDDQPVNQTMNQVGQEHSATAGMTLQSPRARSSAPRREMTARSMLDADASTRVVLQSKLATTTETGGNRRDRSGTIASACSHESAATTPEPSSPSSSRSPCPTTLQSTAGTEDAPPPVQVGSLSSAIQEGVAQPARGLADRGTCCSQRHPPSTPCLNKDARSNGTHGEATTDQSGAATIPLILMTTHGTAADAPVVLRRLNISPSTLQELMEMAP